MISKSQVLVKNGTPGWDRTNDLQIRKMASELAPTRYNSRELRSFGFPTVVNSCQGFKADYNSGMSGDGKGLSRGAG